jgi:hypothetical protein
LPAPNVSMSVIWARATERGRNAIAMQATAKRTTAAETRMWISKLRAY